MNEKQTHTDSQNQVLREESSPELSSTMSATNKVKNPAIQKARIKTLNDLFRTTFLGGKVLLTSGVNSLDNQSAQALMKKVRTFSEFTKDNDPYGERDFGIIKHEGETFYWKIDYYKKDMEGGSEDPSDPEVTTRVLTIMQRSEY